MPKVPDRMGIYLAFDTFLSHPFVTRAKDLVSRPSRLHLLEHDVLHPICRAQPLQQARRHATLAKRSPEDIPEVLSVCMHPERRDAEVDVQDVPFLYHRVGPGPPGERARVEGLDPGLVPGRAVVRLHFVAEPPLQILSRSSHEHIYSGHVCVSQLADLTYFCSRYAWNDNPLAERLLHQSPCRLLHLPIVLDLPGHPPAHILNRQHRDIHEAARPPLPELLLQHRKLTDVHPPSKCVVAVGVHCDCPRAVRSENGAERGPDGAGVVDPRERVWMACEGGRVGVEEDDRPAVRGELGSGLDGPPYRVFGVLALAHLVMRRYQGIETRRRYSMYIQV